MYRLASTLIPTPSASHHFTALLCFHHELEDHGDARVRNAGVRLRARAVKGIQGTGTTRLRIMARLGLIASRCGVLGQDMLWLDIAVARVC